MRKRTTKKKQKKQAPIDINPDFQKALDKLENTNENLFITGKAGAGKSTLLQYFREHTKKNVAILAPTGVAALNVKGQTIHSFFRFPAGVTSETVRQRHLSKDTVLMLEKLDTIVIDEVSMVRADLLDRVDESLRFNLKKNEPFAGIQMVFIGDLYQLPPVVSGPDEMKLFSTFYKSPYFFDAKVFEYVSIELIELAKIYRQKDPKFIELLNKIRNGTVTDEDVHRLNQRHIPHIPEDDDGHITLTTTNAAADAINERHLESLNEDEFTWRGRLSGDFEQKNTPTSLELTLKPDAQIMLLNNDQSGRWVNGSIGRILEIGPEVPGGTDLLTVELTDGSIVSVEPHTWEMTKYFLDEHTNKLESETTGSFTQYPVRLAWAITIHKSQGKTFDNVVVDIGNGAFSHGQVYVAISRCTSFEGLTLKRPILKKHIWMDRRVIGFLTGYRYAKSEEAMPLDKKIRKIQEAIIVEQALRIEYLTRDDIRSARIVIPHAVGEMEYMGKTYIGLEAYCMERKSVRVFRVDRILTLETADTER